MRLREPGIQCLPLCGGRLNGGGPTTAQICLKDKAALMPFRATCQNRPKEGVAKAKRGNKRGNKTMF